VPRHEAGLLITRLVVKKLIPWLVEFEDIEPEGSPKLSWLPDAVHHPALYHATLLVSAVHLERLRPTTDPRITFWLKAETLRLVNERLDTAVEGASDEIICTVLILLYFNVSVILFRYENSYPCLLLSSIGWRW
jgi:Fungal specific transcription factor domain